MEKRVRGERREEGGEGIGGLVVITPTPFPQLEISGLGVRISGRGLVKKNLSAS